MTPNKTFLCTLNFSLKGNLTRQWCAEQCTEEEVGCNLKPDVVAAVAVLQSFGG